MEKYREKSQVTKTKLIWLVLSIVVLAVWLSVEIKDYYLGRPSFLGIAYIVLFTGLLFWRYAVRYVYILNDRDLTIISQFLSFTRTFTVSLNSVEGYSEKYVRTPFKRTGINRFVHRYSSGDGRVTRSLVFKQQGKLNAVLFKASDQFMEQLKSLILK